MNISVKHHQVPAPLALASIVNKEIDHLHVDDMRDYLPDLIQFQKDGKLPKTLKSYHLDFRIKWHFEINRHQQPDLTRYTQDQTAIAQARAMQQYLQDEQTSHMRKRQVIFKNLMTFLPTFINENHETLQVLDLKIQHESNTRQLMVTVFKDVRTLEKIQIGLLRTISRCEELRQLVVPVFIYTPKVITELTSMLQKLQYLQSLSLFSPETCTLFEGLTITDTEIKKYQDLQRPEFIELGKFVQAVRLCQPLIRLTFDITASSYDQSIQTIYEATQDQITIKAFARQFIRILDFLSQHLTENNTKMQMNALDMP